MGQTVDYRQHGGMRAWRRSLPWLTVHLGLGLVWIALLASQGSSDARLGPGTLQIAAMLLLAGWLPALPLAFWQMQHRRLRSLIASDLLAAGLLVLLACTAYVPLFFFHVVWFLPLALLPRGVLTELLLRGGKSVFQLFHSTTTR